MAATPDRTEVLTVGVVAEVTTVEAAAELVTVEAEEAVEGAG